METQQAHLLDFAQERGEKFCEKLQNQIIFDAVVVPY